MLAGSILSNNIYSLTSDSRNDDSENEQSNKKITLYNSKRQQFPLYASKSTTLIDSRMTNIRLNKLKNHLVIYDKTTFPSNNNNSYASAFAARSQNINNNNPYNRANSMYWYVYHIFWEFKNIILKSHRKKNISPPFKTRH